MQTIKVFVRTPWQQHRVYPYMEEARIFAFDRWIWPDVIKMFLGAKKTLSFEECQRLEKEGVCKFIQCIDPALRIEGIETDFERLQKECDDLKFELEDFREASASDG